MNTAWSNFIENTLRPEFNRIRGLILDDDGIITAAEELALRQAGVFTFEDFTSGFTGIRDAALTGIQTAEATIQSNQASSARSAGRFNIRQARFNLGGATSEGEFDTLFGVLQTAVNDFYDGEERRIRALGLSVEETTRLIDENDLSRREELRGLERITNTFAEDRIDTEMRVQMEIEDLRDDAFENEQDRIDALVELNERYQAKLTEIEREGMRDREDLGRDFSRSLEDILREAGADESFFLSGDFQRAQTLAQIPDTSVLGNFLSSRGINLDAGTLSQIGRLGTQTRRGFEDIDIGVERDQGDLTQDTAGREAEINANAQAQAEALTTALTPLLTRQQTTATTEATTAEMASQTATTEATTATIAEMTAITEATTAMTASETAVTEAGTALIQSGVADLFSTTVPTFATAADTFLEGAIVFRDEIALRRRAAAAAASASAFAAANQDAGGSGDTPGNPDNRLFHFSQTDAILRQVVAREAAALQPRDYLPSFEQVRNAVDLSHHAAQGFIEGVRRNDGLSGDTQGGGVPDEMRADITLNFGDGTVAKLRDQVVRLKQNRRTL